MRHAEDIAELGSVTLEIVTEDTLGRPGKADEREFLRSTLPRLRDEFEQHLVVIRSCSSTDDRPFPRLVVEQELVAAGTYLSHGTLRLVVGRALALKELTALLVAEGETELRRRGLSFECWQEGLLS